MTQKDWEKTLINTDGSGNYFNNKTGTTIFINEIDFKKEWFIRIIPNDKLIFGKYFSKKFKSKTSALKFLQAYMKTH